MKLQLDNQYSFQQVIGYPDDPEPMEPELVKEEIERWAYVIGAWMEGETPSVDQIAGLDGFLSALATEEVEYTNPLETYSYHAGFEYFTKFEVAAESQEQADEKALAMFELVKNDVPTKAGEAVLGFKYLERCADEHRSYNRIYEG